MLVLADKVQKEHSHHGFGRVGHEDAPCERESGGGERTVFVKIGERGVQHNPPEIKPNTEKVIDDFEVTKVEIKR